MDQNAASAAWTRRPSPKMDAVVAEIGCWETSVPRDLAAFKLSENRDEYQEGPHAALIGPLPERGPATGLVVQGQAILGQWGRPERADIAFSVTKTCLATLAGIALGEGLIPALDAPVSQTVKAAEFSGAPNNSITWRHLLTLTSEWKGSLWGIPDSIDFNRAVPKRPDSLAKGTPRERQAPGRYWEFNDVRVNVLALALTHVFGDSLETVLRQRVMDPIGASSDWQWNGYNGAEIELAGRTVTVVAGGAHWGGGMIVSALDLARLGQLQLNRGLWDGKRLVPELWFDAMRAPGWTNPDFGLMWWNNHGGTIPALSPQAIWGSGIANFIAIDPGHDLIVVLRWYDVPRRDEMLGRIVAALPG
ncbi:serine hydrolase [Tropicimonas sp. IMCC34043]|uniref:serine hydrolase domain-containing protein n=1 Tax=Tropicimonas sp. IMCC34043 TaxID=2248760 RepID=UPI000E289687|nr:serine hydrolase [Tropicimonas sp. IMCC34043]